MNESSSSIPHPFLGLISWQERKVVAKPLKLATTSNMYANSFCLSFPTPSRTPVESAEDVRVEEGQEQETGSIHGSEGSVTPPSSPEADRASPFMNPLFVARTEHEISQSTGGTAASAPPTQVQRSPPRMPPPSTPPGGPPAPSTAVKPARPPPAQRSPGMPRKQIGETTATTSPLSAATKTDLKKVSSDKAVASLADSESPVKDSKFGFAKPKKRTSGSDLKADPAPNANRFGASLKDACAASPSKIPVIIQSCIKSLRSDGLDETGLFRVSGSSARVNDLKAAYESGLDPLSAANHDTAPETIASLLKLYLRQVNGAVICSSKYAVFIQAVSTQPEWKRLDAVRMALRTELPPENFLVLSVLCEFLFQVSQHSEENMMPTSNLAVVFGPTLMPSPDDNALLNNSSRINLLVETLIIHHQWLFFSSESTPNPLQPAPEAEHASIAPSVVSAPPRKQRPAPRMPRAATTPESAVDVANAESVPPSQPSVQETEHSQPAHLTSSESKVAERAATDDSSEAPHTVAHTGNISSRVPPVRPKPSPSATKQHTTPTQSHEADAPHTPDENPVSLATQERAEVAETVAPEAPSAQETSEQQAPEEPAAPEEPEEKATEDQASDDVVEKVLAKFDYSSRQPTELSFKAGDVLFILQKPSDSWWYGVLDGSEGYVAVAYLDTAPAPNASDLQQTVTAHEQPSGVPETQRDDEYLQIDDASPVMKAQDSSDAPTFSFSMGHDEAAAAPVEEQATFSISFQPPADDETSTGEEKPGRMDEEDPNWKPPPPVGKGRSFVTLKQATKPAAHQHAAAPPIAPKPRAKPTSEDLPPPAPEDFPAPLLDGTGDLDDLPPPPADDLPPPLNDDIDV